jgi:hypothetical protein
MRNVIDRAIQTGASFDIPERGMALLVVRNREGDDSMAASRSLLNRLQSDGFPVGDAVLTIGDFMKADSLSAISPPIALWPLPLEQRVDLMCGNLFLACVFKHDVWDSAFAACGLTAEIEEASWIVRGPGVPVRFDAMEKAKIRLGVAFSGISPQAVADAIVEVMKSEPPGGAAAAVIRTSAERTRPVR